MVRTADRRCEQQRADSRREKSGRGRVHRGAWEERDVELSQSRVDESRLEDAKTRHGSDKASSSRRVELNERVSARRQSVRNPLSGAYLLLQRPRQARAAMAIGQHRPPTLGDHPSSLAHRPNARALAPPLTSLPHPRASPVGPACQYCVFDRPFHVLFTLQMAANHSRQPAETMVRMRGLRILPGHFQGVYHSESRAGATGRITWCTRDDGPR